MLGTLGSQIGQFMQRKHMEMSARDREALYHSLVDALPLNILRKDRRGVFNFANRLFCESLGKNLD
jgi:PAS domain-containing protein